MGGIDGRAVGTYLRHRLAVAAVENRHAVPHALGVGDEERSDRRPLGVVRTADAESGTRGGDDGDVVDRFQRLQGAGLRRVRSGRPRVLAGTRAVAVGRPSLARLEDTRHVEPAPPFLEEGAYGVPGEVRRRTGVVEDERGAIAVDALEVAERREERWGAVGRAGARGPHEGGDRRGDADDGGRPEVRLLDVAVGWMLFRHGMGR